METAKPKTPEKSKQQGIMAVVLSLAFVAMQAAPAAAVDWTNITTLIDGVAGIMPSITSLISAIVEPIIVLAVVGFLVGMLNGLLGGLEGALRFGR